MKNLIRTLTTAVLLTACAEDDIPPEGVDAVESALVDEIVRDNGNTVQIYEHAPGQWFYVETGLAPTVREGARRLDDFYRAAAPGRELPATISAAQARADQLQIWDTPADEIGGSAENFEPIEVPAVAPRLHSNCTTANFVNGCLAMAGDDQAWCKLDWGGGIYWYNTSANYMTHAVCALDGNVTLRLFVDSEPAGSWTVSEGGYRKIGKIQQPIYLPVPPFYLANRFGFVTDVVNASGDRFMSGGGSGDY
jgi:hypothetical protein